jgi:hypothetical protein
MATLTFQPKQPVTPVAIAIILDGREIGTIEPMTHDPKRLHACLHLGDYPDTYLIQGFGLNNHDAVLDAIATYRVKTKRQAELIEEFAARISAPAPTKEKPCQS